MIGAIEPTSSSFLGLTIEQGPTTNKVVLPSLKAASSISFSSSRVHPYQTADKVVLTPLNLHTLLPSNSLISAEQLSSSPEPDESDPNSKKRPRPNVDQMAVLWKAFNENPMPSAAVRQRLAAQLDMTPRAVQIWFQNRRQWFRTHGVKDMHSSNGPSTVKRSGLHSALAPESKKPAQESNANPKSKTKRALHQNPPTPSSTSPSSPSSSHPHSPYSSPALSPQPSPATSSHQFAASSLLSLVETLIKAERTQNSDDSDATDELEFIKSDNPARPNSENHWRPWL